MNTFFVKLFNMHSVGKISIVSNHYKIFLKKNDFGPKNMFHLNKYDVIWLFAANLMKMFKARMKQLASSHRNESAKKIISMETLKLKFC